MSKIKKLHLLLLVSAAMNIGNVHASAAAAAAAGDEDGTRTNSCASSSSSSSSAAGGGLIPDLQMKDAVKEHFSLSGIADIIEGYATYVMRPGEQAKLESLKISLNDPDFYQCHCGGELSSAAYDDYQAVVQLLLNQAGQLRPDQIEIDKALQKATERGHHEMVNLLDGAAYVMSLGEQFCFEQIQVNLNSTDYSQVKFDGELRSAAYNGYQAVVEMLLNPPAGQLRPNQEGIDEALKGAQNGMRHSKIIKLLKEYYIEDPAYVMKSEEESLLDTVQYHLSFNPFYGQLQLNLALYTSTLHDYRALAKMLLNLPAGQLRPNQEGIDSALLLATGMGNYEGHHEMFKLLKAYGVAGAAAIQAPSVSAPASLQ